MSKLYYRYGMMNATKSTQLLTAAHGYEEQGKNVILFTPSIDDRFGIGKVTSRTGLQRDATVVYTYTNMYEIVKGLNVSCVFIDEVQFMKKHHILQLVEIADELDIPVIAYGLLKDYRNQFFEGSEAMVLHADSKEEIKTTCAHPTCQRKATFILKYKGDEVVYEGPQIEIGGNDTYKSVCRKHYYNPIPKSEYKTMEDKPKIELAH